MNKILVVDDEKNVLSSFRRIFKEYEVITAPNGIEGLDKVREELPDAVVMDIKMPGIDGLEVFKQIKVINSKLPVIIMTAYGTTETAIEAMKLGAFEYTLKPFDINEMREFIKKALEINRLMKVEVVYGVSKEKVEADRIIGSSPAMQRIYKSIGQVASSDVTVLLRGESGTGKELVARAIYQHSLKKDKPFLAVNCAAIPETLLESELFGYEKGAFTGAQTKRIGRFEQCNGGTIFLDEIGDMSLSTQAKILRVLEQRTLERLGSNETIKVDVRIISATHKNLEEMLKKGQFREDLYFRLNVVSINIPPLRERLEDVPLLVNYFLRRYNRELGKELQRVSKEALEILQGYAWPGNVRELENVIKRAVVLGKGNILSPEYLEPRSTFVPERRQELSALVKGIIKERLKLSKSNLYKEIMQEIEKELIIETLKMTQGNQTQTAKLLGITRPTLKEKIREYSLRKEFKIKED
jgi:nitrogen regulation protein NR(I)